MKMQKHIKKYLNLLMKFLMADGAAAITKAWEMATKDNPEFQTFTTERIEVPLSRLMCYFHVDKDCLKIYEKLRIISVLFNCLSPGKSLMKQI